MTPLIESHDTDQLKLLKAVQTLVHSYIGFCCLIKYFVSFTDSSRVGTIAHQNFQLPTVIW